MSCPHCEILAEEIIQLKRSIGLLADERVTLSFSETFGLTPYAAMLLAALYQARGRILTRDFLSEVAPATWRTDFRQGLHVQVCRIRKSVGAAAIETHPGLGYRITDVGRLLCDEALESRARAA